MQLQIPLKKIKPKSDLGTKLESLGLVAVVERIIADIQILNLDQSLIMKTKGIIDTGAIFSLFPGHLLTQYENIYTVAHTMWGIIDSEECRIDVNVGIIPVVFNSESGQNSPVIKITAAFIKEKKTPILLGMKGFLAEYSYAFNSQKRIFTIDFPN